MIDKKLLVLLVVISVYTFFIRPLDRQLAVKRMELAVAIKAVAKEKFIQKQKDNIKKLYPEYIKIINADKSLMFLSSTPVSTDLSQLQNILKSSLRASGMKLVRINWGEIVKKDEYDKLPLSFTARGYPDQFDNFLKKLSKSQKLIRFEQISITKFRKKELLINAIIFGFKMESVKNAKK